MAKIVWHRQPGQVQRRQGPGPFSTALLGILLGAVDTVAYFKYSAAPVSYQSDGKLPVALKSQIDTPTIIGRASVIDGDTIEIHGTRIRLYGIDAPAKAARLVSKRANRRAAGNMRRWRWPTKLVVAP